MEGRQNEINAKKEDGHMGAGRCGVSRGAIADQQFGSRFGRPVANFCSRPNPVALESCYQLPPYYLRIPLRIDGVATSSRAKGKHT